MQDSKECSQNGYNPCTAALTVHLPQSSSLPVWFDITTVDKQALCPHPHLSWTRWSACWVQQSYVSSHQYSSPIWGPSTWAAVTAVTTAQARTFPSVQRAGRLSQLSQPQSRAGLLCHLLGDKNTHTSDSEVLHLLLWSAYSPTESPQRTPSAVQHQKQ